MARRREYEGFYPPEWYETEYAQELLNPTPEPTPTPDYTYPVYTDPIPAPVSDPYYTPPAGYASVGGPYMGPGWGFGPDPEEDPIVDEVPPGEQPIFTPPVYELPTQTPVAGPDEIPDQPPDFTPSPYVDPVYDDFTYAAYAAPERDVARVEELRTKAAGPGVRRAIQAMQRALMQEYRNPNLARLAMRDILAGHGEALSGIYGGAAQTAEGQYGIEFAGEQTAARMKYEAEYGEASTKFQAGWTAKLQKAMADWQAKVEAEKRDYEWELMQGGWM